MSTVTLHRVARSEAIKLVSLRSTVISYVATAIATVGVGAVYLTLPGSQDGAAANAALTGLLLAELLVGLTAVVAAAGEYSAQTIRCTFIAVPCRATVLAAKLAVHVGLVVTLMVVTTLVAVAIDGLVAPDLAAPVTNHTVLRALLGTVMTLVGASVLGISFGMLTRSAAAGIGILFTMMFLPVIVVTAPRVTAFLPGRAAQAVVLADSTPGAHLLAPLTAVVVFLAWLLAAIGATTIVLRRRDA